MTIQVGSKVRRIGGLSGHLKIGEIYTVEHITTFGFLRLVGHNSYSYDPLNFELVRDHYGFVVHRVNGLSPTRIHETREAAKAEAIRLSKVHNDTTFKVLELVPVVDVITETKTIVKEPEQ